MEVILVNVLTSAYNLTIRESPEAETLMLAEKKMLCFSSYTMYPASLSRSYQTVALMNHYCYYLMACGK